MSPTTDAPRRDAGWNSEQLWGAAGRVLGQTALLGALLLFFGWARTRATYAHFGIDLSQLDLSTTEFILRSVNTAYEPLLRLGLLILAGAALHEYLRRAPQRAQQVRRIVGIAGLVVLAFGMSALFIEPWSVFIGRDVLSQRSALEYAWLPETLAAGLGLLAYAFWRDDNRLLPFLLVGLFVASLFWVVSLLAQYDGGERAKQIAHDLPGGTQIVLLSEQSLEIGGPGVLKSELHGDKYRYSYAGLRLLVRAGGKLFLIPSHWHKGDDRVFAVPDASDVRLEMIAAR